ncbi:MAG: BTAD domain-containing putative transcriptional regulator, partial [Gemmatimonadaceae bacterium]
KSLEALAESAELAQDFAKASEWWKTRAARDPYDSRVALRLMQALAASGNRAAALQHASVHQRLLQSEFGVESSSSVAAFAERLRSEPVTRETLSPLRPNEPTATTSLAPVAAAQMATLPATTTRPRRRPIAALLALGSLAALTWSLWPRASTPEGSIAVLPFVNLSPNANNEYFSDGLTEEIITRLAAIPNLKVISRTSAMRYKGSKQPLREIAGELNVAHILEGSVRENEGTLRISAQLVDAKSDAHLWANSYEYELRTPFRVQEEIAHEVARTLEVELGDRTRRLLVRRGTSDPEAYELYRRGRFLWARRSREGHAQALEYFQQAIARDSNYADAYAGIADVYLTDWQLNLSERTEAESYSRVKWAAERAIALDDESADAHVSFAIALWWQKNWPSAERELRRAIELNPNHATAHSWHGLLLRGMGRAQEARQEGRRGYELDPFAPVMANNHAFQCYW